MVSVLVLGGTGFVGCHLCNVFNGEGFDVVAASLNPGNEAFPLDDGIEKRKVNILDNDSLDFEGFDVVVNLVGLSPLREPRGVSYRDIHVEGVENVVEEFNSSDAGFLVHMSALGADKSGDTEYIRTKGEGEDLVREKVDNYVVLRPSVLFGEGGEFVKSIQDVAEKTPVFPLPMKGETRFQPVYIGDLTHGIKNIVKNQGENSGEIFEFGGPEVLSFRDVAEKVFMHVRNSQPVFIPIPRFATFTGLAISEVLPLTPVGLDQYNSLKTDNVLTGDNGFAKLGFETDELSSLDSYLSRN